MHEHDTGFEREARNREPVGVVPDGPDSLDRIVLHGDREGRVEIRPRRGLAQLPTSPRPRPHGPHRPDHTRRRNLRRPPSRSRTRAGKPCRGRRRRLARRPGPARDGRTRARASAPLRACRARSRSSRRRALGCYGDNQLVMTGDAAGGFEPEDVARHEYGHHIAFNRSNTPWKGLEWGPKRWASYEGVCARVRAGTAYPGDQSLLYRLNPGEAFAETYRLLNDMRPGVVELLWPIVDRSFYPDPHALQAVRRTWSGRGRGLPRPSFGAASEGMQLGSPHFALPLPRRGADRAPPAGRVVRRLRPRRWRPARATGRTSSSRETRVTYRICGERSLAVLVSAGARPRFEVDITRP